MNPLQQTLTIIAQNTRADAIHALRVCNQAILMGMPVDVCTSALTAYIDAFEAYSTADRNLMTWEAAQ
jgi:hypothetical protein